jgi:hypothetical protein
MVYGFWWQQVKYIHYLFICLACSFQKFVIIIIMCLGLAVASWPQPGDDLAVSTETVEEMALHVWLMVLALRGTPAR